MGGKNVDLVLLSMVINLGKKRLKRINIIILQEILKLWNPNSQNGLSKLILQGCYLKNKQSIISNEVNDILPPKM
jgi:hypothetical protein